MLKKYGQTIFWKDHWIFIFLHIDGKDVFVYVLHIGNNRVEVYCFEDLLSFGFFIVQKIKDIFFFILIFLFFARFLTDFLGLLLLLKFHTFELKLPRSYISACALSGSTHEKSRTKSLRNCIFIWVWVMVQSKGKVLGVLAILVGYHWESWLFYLFGIFIKEVFLRMFIIVVIVLLFSLEIEVNIKWINQVSALEKSFSLNLFFKTRYPFKSFVVVSHKVQLFEIISDERRNLGGE